MISNSMFHVMTRLANHTSQDSFVQAITDWIILGFYTGFHKSEWCNDHPNDFAKITDPQWCMHATTLAGIAEDFSFATATGSCPSEIHQTADIHITFTTLCN